MRTIDDSMHAWDRADARTAAYNLLAFSRAAVASMTDDQLLTFVEDHLGDCEFDIGWSGDGAEYRERIRLALFEASMRISHILISY